MFRRYTPFFEKVVYDGVNLSRFYDINEIAIGNAPAITLTSVEIPGKIGNHFADIKYGEREIAFKFSINADSRDQRKIYSKWRELSHLVLKNEPKVLMIGERKKINAIVSSVGNLERVGTRGVCEVVFVAFDSWFYGDTHNIELTSGSNEIFISGDQEVFPSLTIKPGGTSLTVTNQDTGSRVVIPKGVTSSTTVTINMERERCEVNGNYLAVTNEQTEFFTLKPGINRISLSSGSGVLTYTERLL